MASSCAIRQAPRSNRGGARATATAAPRTGGTPGAGGVLLGSAVFAVFLPDSTMAAIHRQLALGEYPAAPLTSYLTRSVSALYAFHGGLLLALSADVRRFRPVLRFVAWATVALGLALTAIDFQAPMPRWWRLAEGPWVVLIGCLLIWLVGRTADADGRDGRQP